MIFGFILAIGVTLAQPYLAFGAGQSFGRSGSVGTSRMHGHRFGFFGGDGFDDFGGDGLGQDVTSIAPSTEPELAENRIYVPPRWVNGGYGVQISTPGYWVVPNQAAER
jgi:hypothetical protein